MDALALKATMRATAESLEKFANSATVPLSSMSLKRERRNWLETEIP